MCLTRTDLLTPAIFLDKDGTVLRDVPYNVARDRMHFAPGAQQGLTRIGSLGVPLIIISNQPAIGLGMAREEDLLGVWHELVSMFESAGAVLDDFYYCPHHPQAHAAYYAIDCGCRKPAPGLLKRAAGCHGIDLNRSWFIGDILDDVEAGRRAGCNTILLNNGNETEWRLNAIRTPDRIESDLDAAGKWLSQRNWHAEQGAMV